MQSTYQDKECNGWISQLWLAPLQATAVHCQSGSCCYLAEHECQDRGVVDFHHSRRSSVYNDCCKLYTVLCAGYTVLCALYTVLCALFTVLCALYTVLCALYTLLCEMYTVLCALYTVLCNMCTLYYTDYFYSSAIDSHLDSAVFSGARCNVVASQSKISFLHSVFWSFPTLWCPVHFSIVQCSAEQCSSVHWIVVQ